MFCKKGVLGNFAKFTGTHLCQSLFFNKVAGFRPQGFPVNFVKFLRTPFLTEHVRWLLLYQRVFPHKITPVIDFSDEAVVQCDAPVVKRLF